ncbi:hypothetical protein TSAR_003382 [Trichomalopsis sarcophagae]|uniref:BHLH domain-containing protein n=1 Tax=Trichomalopsis sarcophagae TaxID=543379 RepID=A0A232FBR3_9HYME|nr:hypothetical protein TSAR_003382 [Trichomalopsis sarcophagae]
MSTMGIAVYGNNNRVDGGNAGEQLMLLRTLQDNERNIIGNNNRAPQALAPKNNVSVINVNTSVNQQIQQHQQNENEQATRRPANQQQNNVLPPYDPSRLKKHGKNGQPPPIAVAKRNARERNRVKQVNNGFATLRQHIPSHVAQGYGDRGKKLSKVETLRMAVEYIRGLQRLLAEADGLDYDAVNASSRANHDSSIMIPSPTGSVYSSSTHNGSGDVLCLAGSELDEQQSVAGGETVVMDDDVDGEGYLLEEEDEDDENKERRDPKRFRDDGGAQNRLSENQNRSSAARRRRNSPTTYYVSRQSTFGDEENIEPLVNRNNNNNINNNNLLTSFSPILLQSSPMNASLPPIKREIRLIDEDDTQRSNEEDPTNAVILASSSPYSGEILIENPETGRLMPLKLEDHEAAAEAASAQLVYVAASAEGLPTTTYYKHDLVEGSTEFMDVVSWWEQEQGRLVHQLQGHHHQVVHQHQPTTHQQQLTAQQRLTHV